MLKSFFESEFVGSLRSYSSLAIPIANSRKLARVSFPCSFMISRPEVNKRMSRVTAGNIKHAFSIFPTYIPSTSLNFNLQISSNIFKSIQIALFQSFSGKSRNLFCDPQAFTCAPGVLGFDISDQSTPSPARSIPEPLSSFTMQLRSASHQVRTKVEVSCPNLKESRCCFQYLSIFMLGIL